MNRDKISFQVPSDFQRIRRKNLKLALKWRLLFRKVAKTLFANGFIIIDYLVLNNKSKDQENYYLFEKK